MKRYIVTEELLQELIDASCEFAVSGSLTGAHVLEACKKIEVPDWATHVAKIDEKMQGNSTNIIQNLRRWQEIPK